MTASAKIGASSLLMLVLSLLAAVGAPPSEFVQPPSIWLRFALLMFPALGAGVLLAFVALFAATSAPHAAGALCLAAVFASSVGILIGWGIDAMAGLRGLMPITLLAVPALGCVEGLRQIRKERRSKSEFHLEHSAG
jgi:hypothetical protein